MELGLYFDRKCYATDVAHFTPFIYLLQNCYFSFYMQPIPDKALLSLGG